MRLWSIHPSYLDSKGLVACWREGLLAQSVLLKGEYDKSKDCLGKKKTPYYNHPQLIRFKKSEYPLRSIGLFLTSLYKESTEKGYNFDASKIEHFYRIPIEKIPVTSGQVKYEFIHLQNKLLGRNPRQYLFNFTQIYSLSQDDYNYSKINLNPLFTLIDGEVEPWEKVK